MPVQYEKRGPIGIVTLSRPGARNAWGADFNEGIARHFAAMEDDDEIRCAVLTGDEAGGAFSAGANLKDPKTHAMASAAEFIKGIPKRRDRAFEILGNFPKPLVGAVNGFAVGIGCILPFCCDLLVASERAEWRLPQLALGILPAYGGAARLARWVGRGHAMRLTLGFPLDAEEAQRIGLAQWLVPHARLMDKTLEVAGHLASLPPLAARLGKESLLRGLDVPNLADASLVDLYRFATLELTEDKAEGHAAWREKRKPTFQGRRASVFLPLSRKESIMPRVAPVTGKSEVPAEHHAVVDDVLKVFGNVRGPFSMLLHSPKLAERVLPLVTFFRDESVVDAKLRSIAILSAVREREAAYVWAAQVGAARRNGLREEVIDLLRAKGDPAKLPAEERDIVIYVRQLMRTNRVDQAVFDALQKRHGTQWLVELTAAANYFALLSAVVNAFEVAAP